MSAVLAHFSMTNNYARLPICLPEILRDGQIAKELYSDWFNFSPGNMTILNSTKSLNLDFGVGVSIKKKKKLGHC